MTQRSAFQIQLLEKLGAPLLRAVSEVALSQEQAGNGQKHEAERVAELLGKTVQISIGLAGSMDIKDADGDSVRLALAAMAGPLIAAQYRATARVPGDGDIKRMIKALEAVLTFSDNFAPAADNTMRLENMAPGAVPADEGQVSIQYVGALVPVISAVASFPFGRAENKLVQEVADRLVQRSVQMGRSLLGDGVDEQTLKRSELQLLKALADIYVECHQAETRRLMTMDDAARARVAEQAGGMLSMEPVWEAFERRAGMMEVLGKSAAPEAVAARDIQSQPQPQSMGQGGVDNPAAPFIEQPQQPPSYQAEPAQPQSASPLAMFAKKDSAPPQEAPVQNYQQPAQSEMPQVHVPQYQEPEYQQPSYVQADAPQQTTQQPAGASPFSSFAPQDGGAEAGGSDNGGSYNPMSFFKQGDGGNAGDEQGER